LVQVENHARALPARGGEPTPPEQGQQIVGVEDPRPGHAHRLCDILWVETPSKEAGGGARSAELARVACEQLHGLSEALADKLHQFVHDALLSTRRAIAVVQEENHRPAQT
jgi:hypothetical protein